MKREEVDNKISNFRPCMRPSTADEMMLLGPMTYFPNVMLHTGNGQWGVFSFCGGKLLESMIYNTGEAERMFHPEVIKGVKPSRMYL